MRIGIVTNTFPAASETFISNKVLFLSAKGHEVIVFCKFFDAAAWKIINTNNCKVTVVPLGRKNLTQFTITHPQLWPTALEKKNNEILEQYLAAKINSLKLSVVHFEFSGLGLAYIDVLQKISCKKVVSCRGSGEKVKLLTDAARKEKMPVLFANVDAIHCVSGDMRKTVLPYCQQPGKIFINYPSIDPTVFKRTTTYNYHTPVQILSVGRLTFQKGYLTGMLTAKILKDSGCNFKWTIVGDGPQKEEIIFHMHQLGLQNNVHLAGTQPQREVIGLLNESDIFLLPSVYEGIANVALEAMSMQIPVVSTKSGGMDEVITNGENGMLADVYDSASLAKNIFQLVSDEELGRTIGKNARATVLNSFTIEQQIEKFEAVYASLVNSN